MTELEQLLEQHEILAKRLLAGSKPSQHVSQRTAAAEEERTLRQMEYAQMEKMVSAPSAKGTDPILLLKQTRQEEAEQTVFENHMEGPDFSEAAFLQAQQLSRIYERDARRYPGEECPC